MQEGDSVFMPAQVFTQDAKIKELFRKAIQAKVESTRAQMMNNIDEALPSWVSWAFKPIASARFV
jgi:phosphoglycerate-specific signal transduction histidine kinase